MSRKTKGFLSLGLAWPFSQHDGCVPRSHIPEEKEPAAAVAHTTSDISRLSGMLNHDGSNEILFLFFFCFSFLFLSHIAFFLLSLSLLKLAS